MNSKDSSHVSNQESTFICLLLIFITKELVWFWFSELAIAGMTTWTQ